MANLFNNMPESSSIWESFVNVRERVKQLHNYFENYNFYYYHGNLVISLNYKSELASFDSGWDLQFIAKGTISEDKDQYKVVVETCTFITKGSHTFPIDMPDIDLQCDELLNAIAAAFNIIASKFHRTRADMYYHIEELQKNNIINE